VAGTRRKNTLERISKIIVIIDDKNSGCI